MSRRAFIQTAALLLAAAALGAQSVKEVRKTVPLGAGGRVTVETYKGTLRIETWDRSEADIYARIVPDSGFFNAGEAVQATAIRIDGSPGSVWVKSDYSRVNQRGGGLLSLFFSTNSDRPEVHYKIRVPRQINLRVKDYRSESWLEPLEGDLEFETHRGSVAARGVQGSLNFNTYRGEGDFRVLSIGSRNRLETYRGTIRLTLPPGQGFRIDTDLGRHADVSSDFKLPSVRRDSRRTEYRGDVNGGGPSLFIKSYRGDIRLRRGM